MILSYFNIFLFLIIGILIGSIPIILCFILSPRTTEEEKLSPYECGFEPFGSERLRFNVRFYLIAILFIIFDIEVIFLFPWAVVIDVLDGSSINYFFYLFLFFFILGVGFFYEWKKGALEWE